MYQVPFFDTVDELQQHVRNPGNFLSKAEFGFKGINVQDILKLKVAFFQKEIFFLDEFVV